MILKIVKVIGIKLVYILFFTVLLVFVGACFFKTFNRYFMAFSLSLIRCRPSTMRYDTMPNDGHFPR